MKVIYLDGCATTRVDDEVLEAMLPFLRDEYGNPSSPHVMGKRARRAVDDATDAVAALIGADPGSVVFTSGATESNNIALLGMFAHDDRAPVNGFFCPIDHKSSLAVGQALAARGVDARTMRVRRGGQVDLDDLAGRLDLNTRVATAAWINSEIGTVQPVASMAALCHAVGAMLHVDAAQAAGRIPIEVREAGIDTLSVSAHKIHGPKGVGALYVRPEIRHRLRPVMFGGGQHALRSGTIPTHLVVGLGKACELAARRLDAEWRRVRELRATALDILAAGIPGLRVNGDPAASVPHVLNVVLPGVRGESLVSSLRSVAVSTGSACNSGSQEPSYVLTAIGCSAEDANSSIRICLNPRMPFEDLVLGVETLVERARDLSGVAVATPGQA
ncbi:aminotransferase class V-fold PLP-dependent enzyme [Nonomuraea phyllanthi]|uniref:Aminotransferase class V-fold PLP-dependent enzyme n=1 Tax=Nonomuraea phyllanthi TaxID=2219224 RepID=A0A5C4W276_9ACTN|nr:cysteine desulfurase family protein [Nonomuraea phyllanthi]KAB8190938.1 aminotransferase class V-fold PLP-dependent enzyme [Nonomuraea phyllanthi]QFY11932.1 aminotransferase class V-fold PLP-dependent enzyme [Nonomuraea phyllanthi]